MSYIVSQVTGGRVRVLPRGAAARHRRTGRRLPEHDRAAAAVRADRRPRSTSATAAPSRKRISILIHDADFSDLHVCTLWLPPGAPMQTYTMRTHTTKAWSNATISFYAAIAEQRRRLPAHRQRDAAGTRRREANDRTDCVDPDGADAARRPGRPEPRLPTGTSAAAWRRGRCSARSRRRSPAASSSSTSRLGRRPASCSSRPARRWRRGRF